MQKIHRWQYQFIGTTSLPKSIGPIELQAFFTFNDAELAALATRRKDTLKIAAAVQLGFLKMSGSPLSDLKSIPLRLLRHVARQLEVEPVSIATLRSLYERPKTRYEHQWWAMQVLGFRKPEKSDLAPLPAYLASEARDAPSIDVLMQRTTLWLYQRKFTGLPASDIRAFATEAMALSEQGLYTLIRDALGDKTIQQWTNAITKAREDTGRSALEWLGQPPRRKSINAIREQTERIEFLKGLGVHKLDLESVALEKIKAYAADLKNIRPARFKELKEPLRTIRLVCYLKWSLLQATDTAIMLGGRRITKIAADAYREAERLEGKGLLAAHESLLKIFEQVNDPAVSDGEFRELVRQVKEQYTPPKFPTRAAAARWLLSEPNPSIRALLSELHKLDLKGEPGDQNLLRTKFLQDLYRAKETELPDGAHVLCPHTWRPLIEGEDRERALRAVEAMTLVGLRKALRGGAVFVDHSEKFRGRQRLLIGEKDWRKERVHRFEQLGLPTDPHPFLQSLVAELETKLAALEEVADRGEIRLDGDKFHVPKYKPVVPSAEVEQQRKQLFAKIDVVQLPDLILEMDSRVGFSKVILGRAARHPTELLQVYAGMLAHGSSMDASDVALMIPQLTANQVLAGMQWFDNKDAVRAANDTVTSFQRRLPVCAAWGDGSLASSDMMSLDISKHVWVARVDYRRKVPSVGTYTHVSDFWSVMYDQPIILNDRQAGAAIEGVLRQTEVEIDRLAVDTHGYTEFALAMAKLLGFALCPRLARLAERKLYIPSSMKNVPRSLLPHVLPEISLKQIAMHWDNLVRLAASIETGHTSATVALARFGSASSDSPMYRAGRHLGRLIRSIYLCDYLASEELRREIHKILVHGEAVHTLQRAICAGSFSKPRGRQESELYAASGSLTLMTNLCLAWTAAKMQEHLYGDRTSPLPPQELEWLAYVSPAHFSNINFRGIFSFPLEKYEEWLFARAA